MNTFNLHPHEFPSDGLLAVIFHHFRDVGFEPGACQAVLESIVQREGLHRFFDPAAIATGGYFATDALWFDTFDLDRWRFAATYDRRWIEVETDAEGAGDFGQLVFAWASGDPDFREMWTSVLPDLAVPAPAASDVSHGHWARLDGPGIVRREHASLLIDSGTTRIIVDPQGLERTWTTDEGRYPADASALGVDAICLTHSHSDHFSLTSMIGCAREGTRVFVPPVARPNLLCPDVRRCCDIVGLDVAAPRWGEVFTVGDIEVEVLPFYGEQPTRDARTTAPGLRNWGSCFRFDTPSFSAVVLVDSGIDPEGSVFESLRRSVERKGPVDVLLSCCAAFPEVINAGLRSYLFTQPFDAIARTHASRRHGRPSPAITFGPEGVARACDAAQARSFMPYAHGFAGLGVAPQREAMEVARVEAALSDAGVSTRLVRWVPGDTVQLQQGVLTVDHARPLRRPSRSQAAAALGASASR